MLRMFGRIRIQLGHECMTYSNEQRISEYGDLAILNMDWDKLVADFVNRNIQMGLAAELLICYEFCGLIQPLLNTRFTNTVDNKKDTKIYQVNTRLAYAMRSVGKGQAAAKVFCGVMNLPPPPKRFYESLHTLNNATEKVA
ncbi:uncharacterized protein TNCV_1428781 [Trichonephila clavipes]|nr:uncharacterized protein TNCV_1428781 [Trichonephila clavipes]